MYYGANQNIQEKAENLRKRETKAEQILWEKLKNKQLLGLKFRRQHPIEHYIADFYCHKAKLVIEVDGSIHNIPEIKEKDDVRTFEIEKYGITILRFTNEDVYNNMDFVIKKVKKFLSGLKNP
ncbi:MAG: endonuclease domain-containing protein [Bacteroidales bacterium]|nr:endonuclease domain-containing protein [Bacteroidales bacterium]